MDKDKWEFKLAPNLLGKAQLAYAAMNSDDARDYEQVKKTILLRYNINTYIDNAFGPPESRRIGHTGTLL